MIRQTDHHQITQISASKGIGFVWMFEVHNKVTHVNPMDESYCPLILYKSTQIFLGKFIRLSKFTTTTTTYNNFSIEYSSFGSHLDILAVDVWTVVQHFRVDRPTVHLLLLKKSKSRRSIVVLKNTGKYEKDDGKENISISDASSSINK